MLVTKDANNETMNAVPSGASSLPSIPDRKNRGKNATMMMNVALMILVRISTEASKTTCKIFFRSSFGKAEFCFNRLKTFSTSIIASSTSAPMAIAMPPSDMVLMVKPSHFKVKMATMSETGMANSEITVARQFIKNKNKMTTTKTLPSNKVF